MNSYISYIIEFNIALSLIFLIYLLVFRKDSNFSIRRAYLFMGMLISIIFPFLHISFGSVASGISSSIITLDEIIINASAGEFMSATSINILSGLFYGYLSISILFITRIILLLAKVLFHALKSKKTSVSGTDVRLSNRLHASSFFNLIFIDPDLINDNNMDHIIQHEKHHVNLLHSVDRIITEFILALSWANPIVWMFRKSVITNHEYQADNRVITYGTDKVSYQLSILNQYIGSASISNQFSSQIKNRIIMLNKNYRKGSFWKSLLLVPAALVLFFFISCNNEGIDKDISKEAEAQKKELAKETDTPAEDQLFYVVEEMPQWPGSDDMVMEIRKFIATNVKYPQEAKENSVQGKIFVHFIITKTGKVIIPDASQLPPSKNGEGEIEEVVVASYKTINQDDPMPEEKYIQLLKDEGARVMGMLPDMIPGKQRGKNVNVVFTMPITFALQ
jgi:hypothetical protein